MQGLRCHSHTRRALSMLLALVILCMMPVSAFAAGGTTAVPDGKVIPSCTVQYYLKLSDGTQVPIADPVSTVVDNHDTVKDFDVLYGSHDFTLAGVNVDRKSVV